MHPRSPDPREALLRLGGTALLRQLLDEGVARRALAGALARGEVIRPSRGLYVLPGADRIDVEARRLGAAPTCVTLLDRLRLPILTASPTIHLRVAPNRSTGGEHTRPATGTTLHYAGKIAGATELFTALDLSSRCLSVEHQVAVLDCALHRRWIRTSDIGLFTHASMRRRRLLRSLVDVRAESPLESLTRIALARAGLNVETQVTIDGIGRVDLLVEAKVIVELDGREFHSDRRAFNEDRRRDRVAQLRDLTVLRYTYDDVVHRMDVIVNEVRAAVRRTL